MTNNWKNLNVQEFWGEIAASDHLIQIYDNDKHFLNTVEGFAGSGIIAGDSVIIISTQAHLDQLQKRLTDHNFDLDQLIKEDAYIPLEVEDTLAKFMVNGQPDETLFNALISGLLTRARKRSANVRAFGEMVALLWKQGNHEATVKLEQLWHNLHSVERFSLFCAYPKNSFTPIHDQSVVDICRVHSKMIDGQSRPSTEIHYTSL